MSIVLWKKPDSVATALAIIQRRKTLTAAPAVEAEPQPRRVDLLRQCATHRGKPWASRYLLHADGYWQYSGPVEVTPLLANKQYAAAEQVLAPSCVDEETCGCCGAIGVLFHCRRGHIVCCGMSCGEYMRCFCGDEGWTIETDLQTWGFTPRRR